MLRERERGRERPQARKTGYEKGRERERERIEGQNLDSMWPRATRIREDIIQSSRDSYGSGTNECLSYSMESKEIIFKKSGMGFESLTHQHFLF